MEMSANPTDFYAVKNGVNVYPNGSTHKDEEKVLEKLYGKPDKNGFYVDTTAGTSSDMISEARKSIGWGEPSGGNPIHKWYAKRNGSYFGSPSTPWCDMSVTYWGFHSDNYKAVCPKGDRAYTPWHANDFVPLGDWYDGTVENLKKAKEGDVIFFDWGGSNARGNIDHVGVVEKNLGDGRVQTIEGNTNNVCARRVRGAAEVAGYGRPRYGAAKPVPAGEAPKVDLEKGDSGEQVKALQRALVSLGYKLPLYGVDGDYGDETVGAVQAYQRKTKDVSGKALEVDGKYGPLTRGALVRDLKAKK